MSGSNPPEGRRRPRRGRWRVALRYASRDARRHKGRTALVAVMVALPAGLGSASAVLLSSTWDENPSSAVEAALGPDSQVQAQVMLATPVGITQGIDGNGYGPPDDDAPLPAALFTGPVPSDADWTNYPRLDARRYEAALGDALPSGDALVPVARLYGVGLHGSDPALHTRAFATQLDTSSPARSAFGVRGMLGADEVALGRDTAHDLRLGVGDSVTVTLPATERGATAVYNGSGSFLEVPAASTTPAGTYRVGALLERSHESGIVFGPDGPLAAPTSYAAWGDSEASVFGTTTHPATSWLAVGPAPVTWSDVRAANALGATVFSRQVVLHPSAEAEAAEAAFSSDGGTPVSTDVAAVVGGAVALGLLQAILMIGPAFQVGARRASRDLALLAAAGADARTIRRTVLAGGLVVGLTASVASAAVGTLVASTALRLWSSAQVTVPWAWLVAFAAVGTFIAVAAAWLPARRASRLDPVLVLAGRRADPAPRRWPAVVGGVLAAAGTVTALVGAATHQGVLLLVAGIMLAEVGLVLAAGSIVGGLSRLAGRLRGTTRLALRDAARHRARTAPAVAAVLAACAAATAGLVFAGSQAQHDRLSYLPDAATGTFLVGPLGDAGHGLTREDVTTLTPIVDAAGVTEGRLQPVTSVLGDSGNSITVWVSPPTAPADAWIGGSASALGTVVDDGTSTERLRLLGISEPAKAAAALRAGKVVVSPQDVRTDGTVVLNVPGASTDGEPRQVTVPARAVGDDVNPATNLPILPPSAAKQLGLRTRTSALVGTVRAGAWNDAVRTTLNEALIAALPPLKTKSAGMTHAPASAYVEPGRASWGTSQGLAELLIVAGALIVALAAAWIATALAGTESLPDLATLQAVGAPPRTRRRFAAAQSAVITVTGAALGAATGLVIGATLVLSQREQGAEVDPRWMVDVPWPWVAALVVAIPLLGAAAAWLVTRSRLPLARRLDG